MPLRSLPSASGLPQKNPRLAMRGVTPPAKPADPVARLKSKLQTDKPTAPSRLDTLHQELHALQDTAKSAAHAGVVERPMNQQVVSRPTERQLSAIPDKRRDDILGPGTSVARLGQVEATDMSTRGTSVARLGIEEVGGKTGSVARLNTKGQIGDLG